MYIPAQSPANDPSLFESFNDVTTVTINNLQMPPRSAAVSVLDHGFMFSQNIFMGLRLIDGKVPFLSMHLDRFYASAEITKVPLDSRDTVKAYIANAIELNAKRDGYIRVIATPGAGDLGLAGEKCKNPRLIVMIADLKIYPAEVYANGLNLVTAFEHRKIPALCQDYSNNKCGAYLSNKAARDEARAKGGDDALMLTYTDPADLKAVPLVSEAPVANLLAIKRKEGRLLTPSKETNCLNGVTIRGICSIAEGLGLKVERGLYTLDDFYKADEVAMTGTAVGIVAVNKIDHQIIGKGGRGEITRKLERIYNETICQHLESL